MAWKSKNHQKKADKARWRRNRLNINYKLIKNLRDKVRKSCKEQGTKPYGDPIEYLGCTIDEFKEYLNEMFYDAVGIPMTFKDYGGKDGWQLDHIQPLYSFDLNNPDEFKLACFFANYQPLWRSDNAEKGTSDDWIHPQDRI